MKKLLKQCVPSGFSCRKLIYRAEEIKLLGMNKEKPSSQLFLRIWREHSNMDLTLFERLIGKQLNSLKLAS